MARGIPIPTARRRTGTPDQNNLALRTIMKADVASPNRALIIDTYVITHTRVPTWSSYKSGFLRKKISAHASVTPPTRVSVTPGHPSLDILRNANPPCFQLDKQWHVCIGITCAKNLNSLCSVLHWQVYKTFTPASPAPRPPLPHPSVTNPIHKHFIKNRQKRAVRKHLLSQITQ